jgi:hypothetical protein
MDAVSPNLADLTRKRLRRLAMGNNIAPESIALKQQEEKIYTLQAHIALVPTLHEDRKKIPGRPRLKDAIAIETPALLQKEIADIQKVTTDPSLWTTKVFAQIKAEPYQGWGMADSTITIEDHSRKLACPSPCASCAGRGLTPCEQCGTRGQIVCPQCQQQGVEFCYQCQGQGVDPQNPSLPCGLCRGTRYAPCRTCQQRGTIPCPVCHGKGGLRCTPCEGHGVITDVITVTAAANATFHYDRGTNLPAGLRQGLDRVGLANISKGHADIRIIAEEKDEKNSATMRYEAAIPFANLVIDIQGDSYAAGIFGHKGVIVGLKPFLEKALAPDLEKLEDIATGEASLDDILPRRALREALDLFFTDPHHLRSFQRLYPVGFRAETISRIFTNLYQIEKRLTQRVRLLLATLWLLISAALFIIIPATSLIEILRKNIGQAFLAGGEIFLPFVVLALSIVSLSYSPLISLRRYLPKGAGLRPQAIGKIGYVTTGLLIAIFVAGLIINPTKPIWLQKLMIFFV